MEGFGHRHRTAADLLADLETERYRLVHRHRADDCCGGAADEASRQAGRGAEALGWARCQWRGCALGHRARRCGVAAEQRLAPGSLEPCLRLACERSLVLAG